MTSRGGGGEVLHYMVYTQEPLYEDMPPDRVGFLASLS